MPKPPTKYKLLLYVAAPLTVLTGCLIDMTGLLMLGGAIGLAAFMAIEAHRIGTAQPNTEGESHE